MKYVEGAYNKYEHNFIEWSDEALSERMAYLSEHMRVIGATGVRAAQLNREMSHISFEQQERYRERRDVEIEEMWGQHGTMDV